MVKSERSVSNKTKKNDASKRHTRTDQMGSDLRYRRLIEASPLGIQENDPSGIITYSNAAHAKMLGYEPGEIAGKPIWTFYAEPEDREKLKEYLAYLVNEQPPPTPYTGKNRTKDGRLIDVQIDWNYEHDEQGNLIGFTSIITNITERKQTEVALHDSEKRYRQLAELSPDGMYVHVDGEIVFANDSLAKILAYPSPEDFLGTQAIELTAPEYRAHILRLRARVMAGEFTELEPCEFMRFDGSRVPLERTATLVSWDNTPAVLILVRDISEREAAAKVLRTQEQHISSILANIADAVVTIDDRGLIETFNSAAENMFGYATGEVMGQNVSTLMPEPDRSAHNGYIASYQTTGRGKIIGVGAREVTALHRQGHTFPIELTVSEVTLDDGHVFIGAIRDITQRKQAEGALRDSEERFRQMAENISEVFWLSDPMKSEMIYISPAYERVWGRTCQSLYETPLSFVEAIHPEDRERVVKAFEKQSRGDYDEEYRIIRPDGTVREIRDRAFPVKNKHGEVYRVVGIAEDITEEKRRDEQLTQAQKMQAVGQLTGGVAHDFNNLLAVILGNTELLQDEIGDNQRLATINRAGTRGAELTQRLLAFSRKQALQPQSIDLTELVSGLHDLLHRTLGEPVKIVSDVPEETWPVLADPGQLENALLNLAINARDAMPDGGILEIECSNIELREGGMRFSDDVAAGDYVQISVRDTGTGMPKDVLEHVFEPFYTTKEVGEGTGLGLSMVYGFARQSGGDAVIESVPGKGTKVMIFLPRAEVKVASDEPKQGAELKRGRGEAILVLEDDPDVRSLAVAALEGLGYRVLEAGDANAAMRVLEKEADNVDLLLSDVVLPGGVSGPEFAAKAKDLHPKLKVVFMSGYAADLYTHDRIPGFDETLLTKPFGLGDLAKVIHDTLAI